MSVGNSELDQLLVSGREAAPPPPSPALLDAVAGAKPSSPRRPARRLALIVSIGLSQTLAIALATGFRRDIAALPRLWYVAYIGAWALGFGLLAWGANVPRRGQIMARSSLFGPLALAIGFGFMIGGFLLARNAPGISSMYEPSLANVIRFAPYCLTMGMLTSLAPLGIGALLVRGATPRGARWLGAAIGAGSGSLGGLLLHLHCPIAEATHLGFVHGTVVLLAAALGALAVPRLAR